MTVQRSAGPVVVIGQNPALGNASAAGPGVAAPPPYVSGSNENPDAGPSMFGFGVALRDIRTMSRPDGSGLVDGGYPNQDYGYVSNSILAADFAPAALTNNLIAVASSVAANVAMTLRSTSITGLTVLSSAFTVPGTLNVVPAGALMIDAAPSWTSYGTSGAIEGWAGAALGRGIQIAVGGSLTGTNFTLKGYDLYGYPQSETLVGPGTGSVISRKCYKWIASVTPSATSTQTASVGTTDVFEFALMARRPAQTQIWWNNTMVTAPTVGTAGASLSTTGGAWMPADTTSPATLTSGTVRGAYTVTPASNGTIRLQIFQAPLAADLATAAGTWGVTPA